MTFIRVTPFAASPDKECYINSETIAVLTIGTKFATLEFNSDRIDLPITVESAHHIVMFTEATDPLFDPPTSEPKHASLPEIDVATRVASNPQERAYLHKLRESTQHPPLQLSLTSRIAILLRDSFQSMSLDHIAATLSVTPDEALNALWELRDHNIVFQDLTRNEFYHASQRARFEKPVADNCRECDGTGMTPGYNEAPCYFCEGTGKVIYTDPVSSIDNRSISPTHDIISVTFNHLIQQATCDTCKQPVIFKSHEGSRIPIPVHDPSTSAVARPDLPSR